MVSDIERWKISKALRINLDAFLCDVIPKAINNEAGYSIKENKKALSKAREKELLKAENIKKIPIEEKREIARQLGFSGVYRINLYTQQIKPKLIEFEETGKLPYWDSKNYGMDLDKLEKILRRPEHLSAAMTHYSGERPDWFQSYIDQLALGKRKLKNTEWHKVKWALGVDISSVFEELTGTFKMGVQEAYQFIAEELQVDGYDDPRENKKKDDGDKRSTTSYNRGADTVRKEIRKRSRM